MNLCLRDKLLISAIDIGNSIDEKNIINHDHIQRKGNKQVDCSHKIDDETLYSGVSGITLFYIELYKATKDEIQLKRIYNYGECLIKHCHAQTLSHGFYSGRLGTIYTLLKIAEVGKSDYFKNAAIDIGNQFKNIFQKPVDRFNLFDGLSGTILGLLYLHSETNEHWILDAIEDGVACILRSARSDGVGIYWGARKADSSNLDGSFGIEILFLQLSAYFDNPNYKFIAEQVLLHKNQNLNFESDASNSKCNLGVIQPQILNMIYSCDIESYIFNNPSLDWLDKNTELKNKAYDNIKLGTDIWTAVLLCAMSRLKKNNGCKEAALRIAEEYIDRKRQITKKLNFRGKIGCKNNGLFVGNAGIGYVYLHLLKENIVNCLLLPDIVVNKSGSTNHKVYHFKRTEFVEIIINSWYPNTIEVLKRTGLYEELTLDLKFLKKSLMSEIDLVISSSQFEYLQDAYIYESSKLTAENSTEDDVHVPGLQEGVCPEDWIKGQNDDNNLMTKSLVLNHFVKLITSKWNWINGWDSSSDSSYQEDDVYVAYFCENKREIKLNSLQNTILEEFVSPQEVGVVFKLFVESNDFDEKDLEEIKVIFLNQIMFFLFQSILLESEAR